MSWRNPDENDGLKMTVRVAVGALPSVVALLDARLRAAEVRYRTVIGPTDGAYGTLATRGCVPASWSAGPPFLQLGAVGAVPGAVGVVRGARRA